MLTDRPFARVFLDCNRYDEDREINYSFGSIFNNIVNPRFGGAGGFDF